MGTDSTEKMLVGDIGGTTSDMALVNCSEDFKIVARKEYSTGSYSSFEDIISSFKNHLDPDKTTDLETACFGVAGKVTDGSVVMSNADYRIDSDTVQKNTFLSDITIINDFKAAGTGVNLLSQEDLHTVQKGSTDQGTKCILGPGTGLGKSMLAPGKNNQSYHPHPSEGGHITFPAETRRDMKIKQHVANQKDKGYVTCEDLVSGRGLKNIYSFLCRDQAQKDVPPPEEISQRKSSDSKSSQTFDIFMKYLARCARNFVMDTNSYAGVYLYGGIAAKNLSEFGSGFLEEFRRTPPRFKHDLSEVPVKVIKHESIALKGCALAKKRMQS